jgi:membrane protease YdiL (CAAX protease family)
MKFLEHALTRKNEGWKYVVVCVCNLFLFSAIGSIPLVIVALIQPFGLNSFSFDNVTAFSELGLSKNLTLALILFSTVVALVLTILLVKSLHKCSFSEVVNGTKKIRINRFLTGAGVWFILMGLTYASDFLICREDYILQFDLSLFIPLFFVSLIFIPFQTTNEEFLFRGYLAQGLAAWTKNRWAAFLIPSFLFGLMHAFNPEVEEFGFWAMMPQYMCCGLFFGLVSILDDGIELSMGLHAANNIFLSLFVTHRSSALQTDAVLEVLHINPYKDTVLLIGLSLAAVFFFAWKYRWDFRVLKKKIIAG